MSAFGDLAFIVLAAGLGTRMKSPKAKVLHEINGKPMIIYIMETLNKIAGNQIIVVVGYQADKVKKTIDEKYRVTFAEQKTPIGTGHAVMQAVPLIDADIKNIVILCGDVPLVRVDTLKKLIRQHIDEKNDITVQAVKMKNPKGYGRILFDKNNQVSKIVEEADASEDEKKICIINTGIYCVETNLLNDTLEHVQPKNVKKEYYLTDIVEIGYRQEKKIGAVIGHEPNEFMGINSLDELYCAEKMLNNALNKIP